MIDTIVILIPAGYFKVLDYEAFNPTAKNMFESPYYKLSKGYFACIQNPTAKDKKDKNYKPRLTLSKKSTKIGFFISLKIEFSAPKLLFGNNFDELEQSDFENLLDRLNYKLKEMSILIKRETLRFADIGWVFIMEKILYLRILQAPA